MQCEGKEPGMCSLDTWQVYKWGKIQHCPGGLPGQCNGGLVGTPCAECPAGGTRFMGLSIHSNDKETRSDEIHWNSMTFCKWQERLVTIVVQSSCIGTKRGTLFKWLFDLFTLPRWYESSNELWMRRHANGVCFSTKRCKISDRCLLMPSVFRWDMTESGGKCIQCEAWKRVAWVTWWKEKADD